MTQKKKQTNFAKETLRFARPCNIAALANDRPATRETGVIGFANELGSDDDGWARIPYDVIKHTGNGFHAEQVFDLRAANEMVSDFKFRAAKFIKKTGTAFSIPIYVGHPDNEHWVAKKPYAVDRKAYAWVEDLKADAAGMLYKARWSETGKALLANEHFRFASPHWLARQFSRLGWRPYKLVSIGLTNEPNIEGAMANESFGENFEDQNVMNELLKKLLVKLGLAGNQVEAIANEASDALTDAQVVDKLGIILSGKTTAEAALANEKTAHEATQAALATKETALAGQVATLANERERVVDIVADNAVFTGKIAFAERAFLANELTEDFDTRFEKLGQQKKAVKTQRIEKAFASSETTQSPGSTIAALANEYMTKQGLDLREAHSHELAYGHLRRTRKDLFEPK